MCAGFLQQFAGVCRADEPEKNMATVLEQLSNGQTPTRVLCCGHSLGGALATLGAHSAQRQHMFHCIWSTVLAPVIVAIIMTNTTDVVVVIILPIPKLSIHHIILTIT